MLKISELLALRGLDTTAHVRLLRHRDKRYDLEEIHRRGFIELYQSYQSHPVLDCDYVVSFMGLPNSRARLLGVYRVNGYVPAQEQPIPPDFEKLYIIPSDGFFYELSKVAGFEDLADRVVIDWGPGAINWNQRLSNKTDKEVIEILPAGYVTRFPGYLDFVLMFDELVRIVSKPETNREWHQKLAEMAGIYLITDTQTGQQYVGSAYGGSGILGRWMNYVQTLHGGNKQLKQMLEQNPRAVHGFQFTILRTLPLTFTQAEVIEFERLYKKKLGTRAFGLNSN